MVLYIFTWEPDVCCGFQSFAWILSTELRSVEVIGVERALQLHHVPLVKLLRATIGLSLQTPALDHVYCHILLNVLVTSPSWTHTNQNLFTYEPYHQSNTFSSPSVTHTYSQPHGRMFEISLTMWENYVDVLIIRSSQDCESSLCSHKGRFRHCRQLDFPSQCSLWALWWGWAEDVLL